MAQPVVRRNTHSSVALAVAERARTATTQGFGGFDGFDGFGVNNNNMTPQQTQFMASCAQAAMMMQNQRLQGQMPGQRQGSPARASQGLDTQFLTPPSAAVLPAQASNPAAVVPAQASNPAGPLAAQLPLQGEIGEQKALFHLQVESDIQKEADALTQALQARAEAKVLEAEAAEEPDEPKPAMKKPAAGKPKAKAKAKAASKPGWQVEVRTRGDGKQTDKYCHAWSRLQDQGRGREGWLQGEHFLATAQSVSLDSRPAAFSE